MSIVNLADAKARLSELVERAAAGETIHIVRRGKPVAQITAILSPRRPVVLAELQELTGPARGRLESAQASAGAFMRAARDQERY